MTEHGPFKTKANAKAFAAKMRKKGFVATLYKAKTTEGKIKWKVSVTTQK